MVSELKWYWSYYIENVFKSAFSVEHTNIDILLIFMHAMLNVVFLIS